jgi:GT2 family glycosyltransferase
VPAVRPCDSRAQRGAEPNVTTTAPRVAVQILTWNRVDEVVPCLESFACIDYPNFEVIVIDNGSEDETVPTVKRDFPWVTLIENRENLGFCRGNNVGLRYALERGFDYVLLLNSDTKVLPGLITELVAVMESDPRIAIAGAKNVLMENPDYTWGKYGVVTWGPMLVKTIGRFAPDQRLGEPPRDVDWVIANGCLVRRSALEKVGLFDEEFWQCNEDVDWSYRARAAGFRVVYADRAAILHKGGSSADLTRAKVFSYGYFIGRNAFMFARKHANPLQKMKLFIMVWIGILGRITFHLLDNAKHAVLSQRAFVSGMRDGMRGTLRPELITVKWGSAGSRRYRQGIRGRVLRWLGV